MGHSFFVVLPTLSNAQLCSVLQLSQEMLVRTQRLKGFKSTEPRLRSVAGFRPGSASDSGILLHAVVVSHFCSKAGQKWGTRFRGASSFVKWSVVLRPSTLVGDAGQDSTTERVQIDRTRLRSVAGFRPGSASDSGSCCMLLWFPTLRACGEYSGSSSDASNERKLCAGIAAGIRGRAVPTELAN
jgi:hypothetical protein